MAKSAGKYFSLVLPDDVRQEVEAFAADNQTSKAAALVTFARAGIKASIPEEKPLTKADLQEVVSAVAVFREQVLAALPEKAEDIEVEVEPDESYTADDLERARSDGYAEGLQTVRAQVKRAWESLGWLGQMFAKDVLAEIVELPEQNAR